ncbi:DUF6461 domain-containing protein [Nonomuraea candida]|uniref:DUF6461 domain-containing protein n=1 Tax=Nonomuraea candida TaxID=359159 RepID=UPI00069413DF|nr:DUF6461 domain-containing protein [Nonomuraea candida]
MAEAPEELPCFPGYETLGEIYCVSFVRDLSPEEVLRRFGVDEESMEEVAFDELDYRSVESMRADAAGYIGAARVGDWTVVIEPGGWQIAVDGNTYAPVSQGTEVVSVCRHEYARDTFAYIVEGTPVVWFDPMYPEERSGSDPDRFVAKMREVGLDPDHDIDGPGIDHPMESSFALASSITGLSFSTDLRSLRFLGAEPLGGLSGSSMQNQNGASRTLADVLRAQGLL